MLENWCTYEPLFYSDAQKGRYFGQSNFTIFSEGLRRVFSRAARERSATARPVLHRTTHTVANQLLSPAESGVPLASPNVPRDLSFASICDPLLTEANGQHDVAEARRAEAHQANKGLIDPPVLYHARCRVAPRLLHNVIASPEVSEAHYKHWYCTLNPMHWFLVAKEVFTCFWFTVRPFTWHYSELGRTNVGGTTDQQSFEREVRRAVRIIKEREAEQLKRERADETDAEAPAKVQNGAIASPERPLKHRLHLVLFGLSRGATTCFYTAMKLPPHIAAYVSLVIVEAPFDTVDHVIETSSWFPRLNRWMYECFCDYRGRDEEHAAYSYDPAKVYIRCPVAFVMSVRDRRVPNACTQALVDKVKSELVPKQIPAVEVLVLKHSRHPCMALGHKEDQDAYVKFVEGLYDKYCPP